MRFVASKSHDSNRKAKSHPNGRSGFTAFHFKDRFRIASMGCDSNRAHGDIQVWQTNNRLRGTHSASGPKNSLSSVFETILSETVFGPLRKKSRKLRGFPADLPTRVKNESLESKDRWFLTRRASKSLGGRPGLFEDFPRDSFLIFWAGEVWTRLPSLGDCKCMQWYLGIWQALNSPCAEGLDLFAPQASARHPAQNL